MGVAARRPHRRRDEHLRRAGRRSRRRTGRDRLSTIRSRADERVDEPLHLAPWEAAIVWRDRGRLTRPNREGRRRIGVIGAGPGGLCAAIRLREFGAVTVFEKAPGVGGVWWHNTYPGAACDVPSHLYSFSFESKADWSRPYATQPEIKAYLEHLVARYELEPRLRLHTAISAARWNDATARGRSRPRPGMTHEFDVVVGAVGMFNDLITPAIPGLDDFAGHTFHSARWDHAHDLAGERVAAIGSAASAVQFVPEIAKVVGHLDLYQRTPNWVLPKADTPYTDAQLAEFAANPEAVRAERQTVYDRLDHALTFCEQEDQRDLGADGPRQHRTRRGSRDPGEAHAAVSVWLQAAAALERVLPGFQPGQRRARHRRHSHASQRKVSKLPTEPSVRPTR